jgi:protein-disulfide isomerase
MFESNDPTDEVRLRRCAAEAGLDLFRFRREMRGHVHSEKIREIRDGGVRSGVAAVPAFFINSIRYESSFGLATLLAALQAASAGESYRAENEMPANLESRIARQGA